MTSVGSQICKLSHKCFRAMLKKFRRKKKRQLLAKARDEKELIEQQRKESKPGYQEAEKDRLRNVALYEQFEEQQRIKEHKLWLLREEQAQREFQLKKERLEQEKIKREKERKRILAEFEEKQNQETAALEEVLKVKQKKEETLQEALSGLSKESEPWHNPVAPANYNIGQERDQCQFFAKTGCCRFGERCSRGHIHPSVSCVLLIHGMYSHFSIGQSSRDDYDTDMALEFEDNETYLDFKNFYRDVLPEFQKFGKVVQFKVCSNHEPHLRGNVYIQYSREEDAVKAYSGFNGRFYAGKQLTCEFTNVIRWKSAICGLYGRKMCPKGIHCNFLHVFKNPGNEFWEADRDFSNTGSVRKNASSLRSQQRSQHDSNSSRSHDRHRESSRYNSRRYEDDVYSSRRHKRDFSPEYEENSKRKNEEYSRRHSSKRQRFHDGEDREPKSPKSPLSSASSSPGSKRKHKKSKKKKKKYKKNKSKSNENGTDCVV